MAQFGRILKDRLYFSKHLHSNTLEYLAAAAKVVDSGDYEANLLKGQGLLPKVSNEEMRMATGSSSAHGSRRTKTPETNELAL